MNYHLNDNEDFGSNFEFEPKEHPMKNTLEYKILQYLNKNENGDFIDVSELHTNTDLLRDKIDQLDKEKYIQADFGYDFRFGDGDNMSKDCIKGKILLKGVIYLTNIESDISNIDNSVTYNDNSFKGNYTGRDNYGNQLSTEDVIESEIDQTSKHIAKPISKPDKKSFVKKLSSSKWFFALFMLFIEEITLGKIWSLITSLF